MTVRTRLVLIAALATLPALVLILLLAAGQRRHATEEIDADAARIARLTAATYQQSVAGTRQALTAMAQALLLVELDSRACDTIARRLLQTNPHLANVGAARPGGRVFCSAVPSPQPVDASDRDWFQGALRTRGFYGGEVVIGRITKRPVIPVGLPLYDPADRLLAVVFAALDLEWLNRVAAGASLPPHAALNVLDHRGTVVVRHPEPERWVGRPFPDAGLVKAILSEGEGIVEAIGVDGVLRVYAHTAVGGPGAQLHLAVGLSRQEALAGVERDFSVALLLLLLVAAAAVASAWLVGGALVARPVESIASAAGRLAAGDLSARAGLRGTPGEVGDLGRAFDGMADSLQRSTAEQDRAEAEVHRLVDELEVRVRDRTAQLAAANAELEAFAYSVSHDLRAPLRAIDGFSRALEEDHGQRLEPEARAHLGRVRGAVQRMGSLIDDLLKLSRVTRAEIRQEAVNLSAMAREIAEGMRGHDPRREVEFVIAEGARAEGDARLLRVALENLIANACKFTSGRPDARIEFGWSEQDGRTVFHVKDNGVGFDMAYAHRLFVPFQRLHRSAEFPGTGIGLATVHRIVLRHGGQIWAEGSVGEGAIFYFTLGEGV